MAPDPKDPKQQYTPLNAEKSSSVGTGALSIGLLLCLVAACGAFAGGYFLGRSTVPVARAPSSHVLVPPGDASDAREEALGHMSNATAAAMQKLTPNKLAAEMKKLKDVKTVEKTSVDSHEDNESIHRIKTLLKEKKYDAKAICEALGAGGNPCEDDLAKELKKESVDHAKIAAELLQGYFEAGPSSAESPEALKRRLMELPEVEPHHICITGSRAKDVAHKWLSLELQEFLMPSKISPENQCPVWEQKIGHTLLTVASALPDRCAARFKVHLSSCDILVHAHHEECDDLYKLRLIADQSHASLIVLHSGKMLECYNRRHAEAKRAGLLALTDKEMFLHHKVPLEDHAAESHFRRTLAKSLAKSALHMRLRYFNSRDDGSISSLRARLLTGEGKDLILEALKHSQGFAVHPETAKMLRGAPQRRLSDGEAVVIDQGSGYWKLGFAGDDAPRSVVPAVIGYPTGSPLSPQHQKIFDGAMAQRGVLNLNHPVDGGIVTNWRDYETLLQGALHDELQVAPESHPVLVTEPPLNPKSHRERQTQILFETFNVPAMYIVSEHVLSLYASGRTTGIVVGMGDSVAHTVPIYEGYGLPHAVLRMDLGGRDVTDFLANALREKGHFISVADLEAVRDMKEKVGYVAEDFHNELKAKKEKSYTMPNGKKITLGLERFRAPEIMFKPSLVGKEFSGLHRMAFESVMRCDVDIRRDLYNNMVLSGGNSMFPGMAERLAQEVTAYAPSSIKVKVVAPAPGSLLPWTGGSILASLSHFRSMWVKKEEYDESGPSIVHRKCF